MASMTHGLLLLAAVCIGGSGFVDADATQACSPSGEQINATSGAILIPENTTTPEQWSSVRCQWTITVAEGKFIEVKYLRFNLSGPCDNHYLKLYQGSDLQQVYQTDLCLTANNKDFVSTSNVLKIEYFYNSSYPENEFRRVEIRWNTTDSNSTITSYGNSTTNNIPRACYEEVWLNETSGDIFIPENVTSPIPTYVYCQWLIEVPADKVVSLTFPEFDLSNNTYCGSTYIEIFLDFYQDSVYRGSVCRENLPRNFTATTNKLKITFTHHSYSSDAQQNIGEVKIHWDTAEPQSFATSLPTVFNCGLSTTNASSVLSSPNYPYNYPNNAACKWTIAADTNEIIVIHFQTFDLESIYDCRWDYIAVVTSQNTTKYCGNAVQYQTQSFEGAINIYFVSDNKVTRSGFQFSYEVLDESYKPCAGGVLLTNDSGTFSNVALSQSGSTMKQCEWKIQSNSSKFLSIDFNKFNVSCYNGGFEVLDGYYNNLFTHNLCGEELPKSFILESKPIIFRYNYYNYGTPGSFQISWTSTDQGSNTQPTIFNCTNYLTNKNGIISSPGFPNNYSNNVNCRWEIMKGIGESIRIYYLWFDIENGPSCSFDYLQVDYNNNNTLPERECESRYNDYEYSSYFSEANPIVTFHSDESVTGKGFVIAWAATDHNGTLSDMSCGASSLNSSFGFLHSPGFPSSYPKNSDCQWTITAPSNQIIEVGFISVALPNDYSGNSYVCTDNTYLELMDHNKTTVKRICSRPHSDLVTPSNTLYVRFKSDNESYNSGFLLYWNFKDAPTTATPGDCDIKVNTSRGNGYIESPNFPNNYQPNTNCQWTLELEEGQGVYVSTYQLSLESSANCSYDYVEIREMNQQVGRKLCGGNYFSGNFYSSVVFIFHSDAFFESAGFQFSWYTFLGYPSTSSWNNSTTPSYNMNNTTPTYPNNTTKPSNQNSTAITATTPSYNMNNTTPTYPNNTTKPSNQNSTAITGTPSYNIPPACNNELRLNGTSGDINIPENVTSPIPNSLYCQWLIAVPDDKVVSITFLEFNLSNNTNCGNTYMEFFLDYYSESVFKGSVCKNRLPRNFTATTNKLKITFSSYSYYSYGEQNIGSIKVHWEAVEPQNFSTTLPTVFQCGYTTTNKTGGICSPNNPYNYPTDVACLWTIKAKDKEIVGIHFENFKLEPIYDCRWDYIEVVTIQNSTKFCSNAVQYQSKYFEGETKVYFVSDAIVTSPSFQLKYDVYDASYKACAGGITLTNDSGTFSSIALSHKQSGLHLCEWKVLVDSSKFVSVVFDNFNVSCDGEFYILDGNTKNNLYDHNLCGKRTPKPFIATSNSVIFRQYWYNYGTPGTFQVSWNSTAQMNTSQPTNYNCSNYLTAKNGIISSPNFPGNYSNNINCRWEIEKGKQESIRIYYLWHDIENGPGCSFDYLQINYNNNYSAPQTICGSQYYDYEYSSYFSEANPDIIFHSDGSVAGRGFVLAWAASDYNGTLADMSCGASSLTDPFGFLHSPGFPSSYPKNSVCQWTITAPFNQVVVVGFISILLPNQYDSSVSGQVCSRDTYLEFSDQNMTTVKRLCFRPSKDLVSPTNILNVKFKSDNESYNMGFLIYWNFTAASTTSGNCGGILRNNSGMITSPGYPNGYQPNTNCQWTIESQPGQGIYLSSSHFSLEASGNCTADYVMIRQSNQTVGKKYCGYDYFSGDYFGTITISFHSDAFFESSGFQIYWYSTSGPSSTTASNEQVNCPAGQTFTNSSGSFLIGGNVNLNPGYSMYCSWTIVVDPNKVVMIGYTKFNLTGSCSYTYLSVTQDQMNAVQVYKDFLCNTTTGRNFTSTSNSVVFSFYHYATSEYQNPGIVEVVWSEVEPTNMTSSKPVTDYNCGYVATNSSGNITSPGYPAIYGNDLDCKWKIPVAAGQIVILKFADFDVEGHFNCIWDYVNISIAQNWTVHCGRQYISPVNFPGEVDVYFHSDHIVGRKGFNLPYQIVDSSFKACAGGILLNSTSGYFTNLTFPNSNFSTYYQCMWTVQVEAGMVIDITFVEFEVPCQGGSFAVYEDKTNTNVFNSYFCGGQEPRSFVSSSNALRFEYYYQTYGVSGTFNVSWQSVAPKNSTTLPLSYNCGSNITGNKGFIYSPGYPDNYTTNLDCLWTIENPTNANIRLSLLKINLEEVSGCKFDYLYVNGSTTNGQLEKKICRWDYFFDTYYNSDVKIVFHSDEVGADPGFIISWVKLDNDGEPIDTSCYSSESPTSSFGILTSPKFPFSSPTNASCEWQLIALSGKVIELTLIRISLSYDCQGGDYLEVDYGKYGPKQICNDYYDKVLTIPNNTATIKYATDGYNNYEEAVVIWRFQDTNSSALYPSCGGTVTGKGGNITSPNYPSRYAPNLDCYWHIVPPEGKMVGIYIIEMDIENNMNCNADYLTFQEHAYNQTRKLCGYSTTNFITPNLTIHFHSDQLVAGRGFILSWNFTDSMSNNATSNSTISPTISSNWTSVATTTVGVSNASIGTTAPTGATEITTVSSMASTSDTTEKTNVTTSIDVIASTEATTMRHVNTPTGATTITNFTTSKGLTTITNVTLSTSTTTMTHANSSTGATTIANVTTSKGPTTIANDDLSTSTTTMTHAITYTGATTITKVTTSTGGISSPGANSSTGPLTPTGANTMAKATLLTGAIISTGLTTMTNAMNSTGLISTTGPTELLNATTASGSMTNTGATTMATATTSTKATATSSTGSMTNTGPTTMATATTSTGAMTNTGPTAMATATTSTGSMTNTGSTTMATATTSTGAMTNTGPTAMATATSSTGPMTNTGATTMATATTSTGAMTNTGPTAMATATTSTGAMTNTGPSTMATATTSTGAMTNTGPTAMATATSSTGPMTNTGATGSTGSMTNTGATTMVTATSSTGSMTNTGPTAMATATTSTGSMTNTGATTMATATSSTGSMANTGPTAMATATTSTGSMTNTGATTMATSTTVTNATAFTASEGSTATTNALTSPGATAPTTGATTAAATTASAVNNNPTTTSSGRSSITSQLHNFKVIVALMAAFYQLLL